MRLGLSPAHRALESAVEVAVATGQLPKSARAWGRTVLLEELAAVMGLARNSLRNLYYRNDQRLATALQSYVATSHDHVVRGLHDLQFQRFSPIVWKRPQEQLQASRQSLGTAVILVQTAERTLRESPEPPVELRRSVGAVAAEIMACALTFFDGAQRWQLLAEGERLFLSAMAPLAFESDIAAPDAALFAKFWENRATRCGLEWSNIWDDPSLPPAIGMEVAYLAMEELDHAAGWMRRHAGSVRPVDEAERLRQLLADKAKWLAKAGRFGEAKSELAKLPDSASPAARADALLVRTLEEIAGNRMKQAGRSGGELGELIADNEDEGALAPVTSAIMVHNIELLRGRRPPIPDRIQHFLAASPVVASELVNLPRYRARLDALGYRRAAASAS